MLSCGTEINLLKDVKTDIADDETPVKMVKFAEHKLQELADSDKLLMPANRDPSQTFVEKFELESGNKVTLISKISPTETMIYTNGGYSFKYTEKVEGEVSEKDNTLEKFVAKDREEPDEQECSDFSCKCKKSTIDKRYVTANDKYMVWITKQWNTQTSGQQQNTDHWELISCSKLDDTTTASTGHANVPPKDFEKDKADKAIEPLLLYLKPDPKPNDKTQSAEALIYSNRKLFVWSNHLKDTRGAALYKGKNDKPEELLPRADAREKQLLLGGMTSTAGGVTVWLKNSDGAIIYIYQGNKEHTNENKEKIITPQFNLHSKLELDVNYKDTDKDKPVKNFAIWLPSDKTKSELSETIKDPEGKVVGVSNDNKKLLVAEAKKVDVVDEEE